MPKPKATAGAAPMPAPAHPQALLDEVLGCLARYPDLPGAWLTPDHTTFFDYALALKAVGGDETKLTSLAR